jgi:hypothetical protein
VVASTLFALLTTVASPDTTFVLGRVEREITGDSVPEVLQLVAVGKTLDSLDVTFTIVSSGRVIFRLRMVPVTPRTFDGQRRIPDSEYRARISEYGKWFFLEEKFQSPDEYVDYLTRAARRRAELIPHVIAKARPQTDLRSGADIWQEIRESKATVFSFSPGGDRIMALAWDANSRRFFNLIECC